MDSRVGRITPKTIFERLSMTRIESPSPSSTTTNYSTPSTTDNQLGKTSDADSHDAGAGQPALGRRRQSEGRAAGQPGARRRGPGRARRGRRQDPQPRPVAGRRHGALPAADRSRHRARRHRRRGRLDDPGLVRGQDPALLRGGRRPDPGGPAGRGQEPDPHRPGRAHGRAAARLARRRSRGAAQGPGGWARQGRARRRRVRRARAQPLHLEKSRPVAEQNTPQADRERERQGGHGHHGGRQKDDEEQEKELAEEEL